MRNDEIESVQLNSSYIANILEAIGNTPLIALQKFLPDIEFFLYGKLEGINPGGSAKDRSAFSMLQHAIRSGVIKKGSIVIESSSGNLAIGLAQACCYMDLKLVCVVDTKITMQNINILRAFGAKVITVSEPDPHTGDFLQARIKRVQQLLLEIPGSFWPNQYANYHNAYAHIITMKEIAESLNYNVNYLICSTSTCGTLRGCFQYIKEQKLDVKIIAVDAVGSVIFGGEKRERLLPGHGSAKKPELLDGVEVDHIIHVSDLDCVIGCRHLVATEGILAGASSGGVVIATSRLRDYFKPKSNCVAILPDRGERYLDTVYSDKWVNKQFGEIPTMEDIVDLDTR